MTKKHDYPNTHPTEYEQGRRARLSSISRDEAPFADATGDDNKSIKSEALAAWQAGFDDAEGEAARNETSGPDSAPSAGDQLSMAADANKAKAAK